MMNNMHEKRGSLSNTYRDNYKTTKWIFSLPTIETFGSTSIYYDRAGDRKYYSSFNYYQKSQ